MQKRTSYEFEGKVGYTYVTKAYGNSDVRFETHFRASENEMDVIQFGVDCGTARSILRSLTRAVIEADKDLGLDALQCIVKEHEDALQEYADSQE